MNFIGRLTPQADKSFLPAGLKRTRGATSPQWVDFLYQAGRVRLVPCFAKMNFIGQPTPQADKSFVLAGLKRTHGATSPRRIDFLFIKPGRIRFVPFFAVDSADQNSDPVLRL